MGKKAFGIKLEYSIDDKSTWVPVAEIQDITPPGYSKETVDTTNHGTADGVRTKRGGLVDGGEGSVVLDYDPSLASHQFLRTRAETANDDPLDFRITMPGDESSEEFKAVVTNFEVSAPIEGDLEATITLARSGKGTYATA